MANYLSRSRLLAGLLLAAAAQTVDATTWNFFPGGGSYVLSSGSSYGNTRTYTQDGAALRVTAWSDTADVPANGFETAFLGRYSTGLGVCNRDEGSVTDCIDGGLDHQVDNVSQQDLVLFRFDTTMAMQSITIDPYGAWDRDVSFWVGTAAPALDLSGYTFADLGSLGFGSQVNSLNGISGDPLTISLGGLEGNVLLFSGLYPADSQADRFKIRSLTATPAMDTVVPLPAAVWLFASGIGTLAGLRRRR